VRFKAATCGSRIEIPSLESLRVADARFAEASLALARPEVAAAGRRGPGRAEARLEEAVSRFPDSPIATFVSGQLQQAIGLCDQALEFYGRTLALQPDHELALLGRSECLTILGRPEDAIAAATRVVDLDAAYVSDGYYWRAWNRHALGRLAPARADIDAARRRAISGEMLTLAGMIEHDQDDLDAAERDLKAARAMPGGPRNCPAGWFLALVHARREAWPAAAELFEEAMTCFDRRASDNERGRAAIAADATLESGFQSRRIEALDLEIRADRTKQRAAALNATSCYGNAGDRAAARRMLDIAAGDPALADRVGELRAWLDE
jgi:tetratricopeptide (TPR) repeat protein